MVAAAISRSGCVPNTNMNQFRELLQPSRSLANRRKENRCLPCVASQRFPRAQARLERA